MDEQNKDSKSNPMRDQVLSLPALIGEQIEGLGYKIKALLTAGDCFSPRTIVITGCGDSLMAAQATCLSFLKIAGVQTIALPAMQASRFWAEYPTASIPSNPLAFIISSSGEVARSVEAARRLKNNGALTVGVTSRLEGRLAGEVDKVLEMVIPPFTPAPGVRSYLMSLLTLNLCAIRVGEVKNTISSREALELYFELLSVAGLIGETIEAVDDAMKKLAEEWADHEHYQLIGSGPSYGSAAYGKAKILEAVGAFTDCEDIEEWCHSGYFISRPENTATIVLSPLAAKSRSRVLEVVGFLNKLGRPFIVIGGKDEKLESLTTRICSLPGQIREEFAPMIELIPLALFAGYLNVLAGAQYARGMQGKWADSFMGGSIVNSAIEA